MQLLKSHIKYSDIIKIKATNIYICSCEGNILTAFSFVTLRSIQKDWYKSKHDKFFSSKGSSGVQCKPVQCADHIMVFIFPPTETPSSLDWDAVKAPKRYKPGNASTNTALQLREKAGNQSTKHERKNKIKTLKTAVQSKRGTREVRILMQENLPRSRITAYQEGYLAGVLN